MFPASWKCLKQLLLRKCFFLVVSKRICSSTCPFWAFQGGFDMYTMVTFENCFLRVNPLKVKRKKLWKGFEIIRIFAFKIFVEGLFLLFISQASYKGIEIGVFVCLFVFSVGVKVMRVSGNVSQNLATHPASETWEVSLLEVVPSLLWGRKGRKRKGRKEGRKEGKKEEGNENL